MRSDRDSNVRGQLLAQLLGGARFALGTLLFIMVGFAWSWLVIFVLPIPPGSDLQLWLLLLMPGLLLLYAVWRLVRLALGLLGDRDDHFS